MDIKRFFNRLDRARKAMGHSVEKACEEMGISRPTWYVWSKGDTTRIGGTLQKAAERYIEASKKK